MERRYSSTAQYSSGAHVKPVHVGVATAIIVFLTGISIVVMRREGTLPSPSARLVVSAAAPTVSASAPPANSSLPEPVASGAPSALPAAEKPIARCSPEPSLNIVHRDIPVADQELFRVLQDNPNALGSASIGTPTRGFLFGGVELPESEAIKHEGGYAFGTELVVRSIERAVREVRRCFPNTPTLRVGDISRDKGGWLKPHRSHQSGLDADLGYYYRIQAGWYEKATAANLDLARTWALVRAFVEGGNVDTIFIDLTVQRILKTYVATLPKEEQPAEDWFQSPLKKDTVIRHAWGHVTHFHVRFRDEEAVALGTRIKDMVPKLRKGKLKRP